jgi:hypothetical protein
VKNKPLPRPSKVRCCVSGMSWLVIRGGPLECRCIASAKGFRGAGCFVAAISGQRNPRQIDKVGPAAKRYARGKVWFLEARIWNGVNLKFLDQLVTEYDRLISWLPSSTIGSNRLFGNTQHKNIYCSTYWVPTKSGVR